MSICVADLFKDRAVDDERVHLDCLEPEAYTDRPEERERIEGREVVGEDQRDVQRELH